MAGRVPLHSANFHTNPRNSPRKKLHRVEEQALRHQPATNRCRMTWTTEKKKKVLRMNGGNRKNKHSKYLVTIGQSNISINKNINIVARIVTNKQNSTAQTRGTCTGKRWCLP